MHMLSICELHESSIFAKVTKYLHREQLINDEYYTSRNYYTSHNFPSIGTVNYLYTPFPDKYFFSTDLFNGN